MSYTSSYWAADRQPGLDAEPQHALTPEHGDPGPSNRLTRQALRKLRREAGQLNGGTSSSFSRGTTPPSNAPKRRGPLLLEKTCNDALVPWLPPPPTESQIAREEASQRQAAERWAQYIEELEEHDPHALEYYPSPSTSPRYSSEWSRDGEFQRLRDEMLEAARFRPEDRSLFHTHGGSAFSSQRDKDDSASAATLDDPSQAASVQDDAGSPPALASELFPPHRAINGAAELAGFVAASSYIVSLGGPPLPDLRYGIIIMPVGDESLLFKGYGDHASMPAGFAKEVHARSKEVKQGLRAELGRKRTEEGFDRFATEVVEELDEEERDFYRQRWLARGGNEELSELGGDGEGRGYDDRGSARSISTEEMIRRAREEMARRARERPESPLTEGSQASDRAQKVEQDGREPDL